MQYTESSIYVYDLKIDSLVMGLCLGLMSYEISPCHVIVLLGQPC